MYLIGSAVGSLLEFTRTFSKIEDRTNTVLLLLNLRKRAWAAVAVSLCLAQSLPTFGEDLPPDTVKRSLALATPTPKSLSHSRSTYNKKAVRSAVRTSYPKSHMEKGLYLKQKNDLNGALIEFLNATQENPHLVKGFYEQALIFRERGYRKLAESALEQALSTRPEYTEARVLLATVRLEQGNFGGAVQELSKSLGLTPNSELHNNAAVKDDSNGLLGLTLPAILQSVHGLLTPEPVVQETTPKQTAAVPLESQTVADLLNQSDLDVKSEHKKKKKRRSVSDLLAAAKDSISPQEPEPEKKKSKQKKKDGLTLLSHLKRGDEMAPPGEELASLTESNAASSSSSNSHKRAKKKSKSRNEEREKLPWEGEKAESETSTPSQSTSATAAAGESAKDPLVAAGITSAALADRETEIAKTLAEAKVNEQANNNDPPSSIFGNATAFSAQKRAVPNSSILGSLFTAAPGSDRQGAENPASPPVKLVKLDNDEWAKKLKYYADNGANSLKQGEAFMFSEDTGEASLFLSDGTTIRRIIDQPKDAKDVMRQRRPDIASNADDMLFGLSLLGKLIPKMDMSQPAAAVPAPSDPIGTFRGDNLMSGSQSFWGWLKTVLKF